MSVPSRSDPAYAAGAMSRIFAVIPAAGQSRRMGRPKQLVDVGGRPLVLGVVQAFCAADVAEVVVVLNPDVASRLEVASCPNVQPIVNPDPASEMIDSVRLGIRALLDRYSSGPRDGLLVCPGDHAGLAAADVDRCIAVFRDSPQAIVIATRDGRRGHPILLPGELIDRVFSEECDVGLRALPAAEAGRIIEVPCQSPGVVLDVDTPEDLKRARGGRDQSLQ